MRVVGLWRYPVKSMGGEPLPGVEIGERGLVGDRVLAVVSVGSGQVLTAKREPRLLSASARWLHDHVEITLPSGRSVRSDDSGAADVLSAWLGRKVRLALPGPRPASVEPYSAKPGGTVFDSTFDLPEWGFFDDAPIHLLGEDSLRQGSEWHPQGDWDVRRFRPNIVLDGPVAQSGQAELGDARLEITGPCKRCVMVTQPQGPLAVDRKVLSTLVKRSAAEFGVYGSVTRTGSVRVGDHLERSQLPAPTAGRPL